MKATLRQIADISNGYQFRGRVEPVDVPQGDGAMSPLPPGLYRVIQIKDIDDQWRLHTDHLDVVQPDRDPKKYEIRRGDVLFLGRGHRLLATTVNKTVCRTIATGYFFIVRPKSDRVRAHYLAWYINQPPFQSLLRTFVKGTQQPLVSRSEIEGLPIEIPPVEIQDAITALDDLRMREQRLLSEIREKRSQLVAAISVGAARRTS